MKSFLLIPLLIVLAVVINAAAYVTNFIYCIHHFSAAISVESIVAFVGIVAAPLGMLHGYYLWF